MRGRDYGELAAFVAVVEELSFRRAATRLGLSPSALSHTVRGLEERLGVRLLNRTTRSVATTDAGLALFARLAPAFGDISSALEGVSAYREGPAGTVRVNLPKLAADLIFRKTLGAFARKYPDVRLELTIDDAFTDIVAGGFDAGVRPGGLLQQDMVAVRATPDLRIAIVGAPSYFASRNAAGEGVPRHPRDLHLHSCIAHRLTRTGATYRWPFEKRGKVLELEPKGALVVNDVDLALAAALDGAGLTCTLEDQVAEHLRAGRLVRVLEDWCQPFPGFFLYYPSRRQMPVALRALVDFLRARPQSEDGAARKSKSTPHRRGSTHTGSKSRAG